MNYFTDLKLDPKVLKAIEDLGYEEPTPIQKKAIPIGLKGKDLIGQAQTGTGKTAAFGIPLVNKITADEEQISALVLAPTRELAIQVAVEIGKLGRYKGVRSLAVYGGQDIGKQIRALKKRPQIIIGTPGRLLDHIQRRTIRLDHIKTVVLDEADEMLDMGFLEDIRGHFGKGAAGKADDAVFSDHAAEHPKAGAAFFTRSRAYFHHSETGERTQHCPDVYGSNGKTEI